MVDKKQMIYNSAEKLFSELGFKETNVSKITKDAGIGVGTYYSYYASKEELFMEIYRDHNNALKEKMLKKIDPDGEPLEVIGSLMQYNYQGMMEDKIMCQWYDREAFKKIEEKYLTQKGGDDVSYYYDVFFEIISKWQSEGKMRSDIDTEVIMAMFGALMSIDTHKDEIGIKYFPEVTHRLAEFIIKGLTE